MPSTLNEWQIYAAQTLIPTFSGTLNEAQYLTAVAIATGVVPKNPGTVAYTVGAGGTYADLQTAITALNAMAIMPTSVVTLTILDGTFTAVTPVAITSPFGRQINIVGQNTYTKTTSSVQSSSGSAGAWSVILNVNSVANIAVNDYAVISAPSGGTNPTYLAGCWKITNVDAVNTRITVLSTHRNATPPSGNVISTVTVLKSVLAFTGCDGFHIWNGGVTLNLDKLAVVGDGTASTVGIANDDVDRVYSATVLGVSGFATGFQALQNCETNSDGVLAASNCTKGFLAYIGGSFNGTLISSGNSDDGIAADVGGVVRGSSSSIVTGNGNNGWHATNGGCIYPASSTATGNTGTGYYAQTGSFVDITSVTTANNGTATNVGVDSNDNVTAASGKKLRWSGSTYFVAPANGVWQAAPNTGTQLTVAGLPNAGTAGSGSRAFVTDATATTFASIVAGTGPNGVPVYSDGTNWRIG